MLLTFLGKSLRLFIHVRQVRALDEAAASVQWSSILRISYLCEYISTRSLVVISSLPHFEGFSRGIHTDTFVITEWPTCSSSAFPHGRLLCCGISSPIQSPAVVALWSRSDARRPSGIVTYSSDDVLCPKPRVLCSISKSRKSLNSSTAVAPATTAFLV